MNLLHALSNKTLHLQTITPQYSNKLSPSVKRQRELKFKKISLWRQGEKWLSAAHVRQLTLSASCKKQSYQEICGRHIIFLHLLIFPYLKFSLSHENVLSECLRPAVWITYRWTLLCLKNYLDLNSFGVQRSSVLDLGWLGGRNWIKYLWLCFYNHLNQRIVVFSFASGQFTEKFYKVFPRFCN